MFGISNELIGIANFVKKRPFLLVLAPAIGLHLLNYSVYPVKSPPGGR